MTMIEKVAAAIAHELSTVRLSEGIPKDCPLFTDEGALSLARAAVKAMSDPTEAMLKAGQEATYRAMFAASTAKE